jgi:hypothetical protein
VTDGNGELDVAAAAATEATVTVTTAAFLADAFRGFFSAGNGGVTNAAVCRFRERVTTVADRVGECGRIDKEGAMMVKQWLLPTCATPHHSGRNRQILAGNAFLKASWPGCDVM